MRQLKLVCTLVALTAFTAVISSQTSSGHAVFEQALAKERVEGNLPEAIKLYERVVAEFASDRSLAARALVQIGLSYEKLGRDEAVRAYERLVRDFADQQDAVVQARARLAALQRPAQGAAAPATNTEIRALNQLVANGNGELLTVSPDGTKVAFLNYENGQNLAVYDLTTQQTTRLTDFDWSSGSFWMYDAAWSPDSRRIAYRKCPNNSADDLQACELRATALTGESSVITRTQAIAMRPGGWLPDGSALVVTLARPDRTGTVGLVPTDGGPFVPLRSFGGWLGRAAPLPSVAHDGRYIAFVDGSPGDIHVVSRDGRNAYRITDHPADDSYPVWSPDGRHLAFLSDRGGLPALWTVAIRDGQPTGEPVRIRDGMQGVYPVLGWTPRGLAYSQYQQTEDIHTVPVNPATGEPAGSPRLIPYRRTGHNILPEWSPDGRYLAFVTSTEPQRRTLVVLPSGGGEPREFPAPVSRLWTLRWFGDSRGLGIAGHDATGARQLFRLTLATGEWKTFPLAATELQWNGMYFDWNADGSKYFYSWQDAWAPSLITIVERDLDSDRERIVHRAKPTDPVDRYRGLRFSPDRRSLSFRSRAGLQVLDVETGQVRVLQDEVAGEPASPDRPAEVPTWSRDGRVLLVNRTLNRGTDKPTTDLRLVAVDGKEVRRIPLGADLTRLLSSSRSAPTPSIESMVWSPDGSRVALALRSTRLETFIIENPLELAGVVETTARK
jgi:Tol biopolymer transport system component